MTVPSAWEATNAPSIVASAIRASRIVTGLSGVVEGDCDLLAQAVEPEAADAGGDDLDLVSPAGRRLHGEDDQRAKEAGMALERLGGRREHRGMFCVMRSNSANDGTERDR